jgi:O-antigen/teichoic acid export membrane protein
MSSVRRIAKNFMVLGIAEIISMVLSPVLIVLITRLIGDEGYGKLSFAMSLAAILTILTPLGLDSLMIRAVARNRETAAKYLGNILVIELLMSVPCFGFVALASSLMHLPTDSTIVLYISGGYYILLILTGTIKYIFRSYEKMEYEAFLTILRNLLTAGAGAAVLLLGYGLFAVAYAYLAGAAVELGLTLLIVLKRFVRPRIEIDFAFWRQIIPPAIPFAAFSLMVVIYGQVDVVILRAMHGDAAVGWYRAATVVTAVPAVIPALVSYATYPAMSRLYVSSTDSMEFMVRKTTNYLLLLGLPVAAGIVLLARPIVSMLFGADFTSAVPALRILALSIPFSFLNAALGTMLASVDRQRLRLFCYMASTVVRTALVLFLVRRFSLTGAAVAIVTSEALLFVLNYHSSVKYVPRLMLGRSVVKPLVSTIVMAALVLALRGLHPLLLAIMAAAVYFAVFLGIRGLDGDDRALISDVWRWIRGSR